MKFPDAKEIEKELSDFLTKKFGGGVKIVSQQVSHEEIQLENKPHKKNKIINFNLKPDDLIAYLDRYIIKQEKAKAILATKICTHFNRIKFFESDKDGDIYDMVGGVKNNILMIGPTGVGKTYMIKLIAKKIGVPFVKGDATKFSETGYVGGDVEDLARDLVKEADGDIEAAKYGIIYIDEIDKIASSRNIIGADVSRTGVQRALLKPMEETDVDLKNPTDPISLIQEIEFFKKTGKRTKRTINTKNILFIMSGAFSDIHQIIKKRITQQQIGFGSHIEKTKNQDEMLLNIKAEDLVEYGFETEFIGRLPVKAIFEKLTQDDLYQILKNPNNPIILGKKMDFASYGIDVKFDDNALQFLSKKAYEEKTGARGIVSAVEDVILFFEKTLPSSSIKKFPATYEMVENPDKYLEKLLSSSDCDINKSFENLVFEEKKYVKDYILSNKKVFTEKFKLNLTAQRVDMITELYSTNILDIDAIIKKIKPYYEETKKIEHYFFNDNDINFILDEDAIDFIAEELMKLSSPIEAVYERILNNFEYGLKLVKDKTGKDSFLINKGALLSPESYLDDLIKSEFGILK